MAVPVEIFFIDRASGHTLKSQLQQFVAEQVLSGRFQAGQKMPSSRKLADHLGVARITITLAYTELVANDFLVARGRSGYFVSDSAPRRPSFAPQRNGQNRRFDWSAGIARRFSGQSHLTRPPNWSAFRYPFIYGQCDAGLFDHQNWRLCALQALGQKDFATLASDNYERDDPMLIDCIVRQILPRRGISARPEEVLLTMGAQNALWMAAQILLTKDRTAVLEDPCYPGLREILEQSRCRTIPVSVDAGGLPPDRVPDNADVVFTTASHHCPTNATMPVERRKTLLERSQREGFVIVEDDYEFEISFHKSTSPALKSLDRAGSVVYAGSFSKSLFPGLRLGYLVAPAPFIEQARALRTLIMRHVPGHTQRAAAYFLSLGLYDAQLGRMRRAYRQRRAIMDECLREHGLQAASGETHGGSSYWMRAPDGVNTTQLSLMLREKSVLIEPGRAFFDANTGNEDFYRLAYSSIATAAIPAGIAVLAQAIAETGQQH